MTLEEMLLENRVIFLVGEINHISAARTYMQMLYLQSVKRDQDINLYINSPGGVVDDTLAMYDIMRFLTCDVATYCIGRAESGGAVVFMAGGLLRRRGAHHRRLRHHQHVALGLGERAKGRVLRADHLNCRRFVHRFERRSVRPARRAIATRGDHRMRFRRAGGGQ